MNQFNLISIFTYLVVPALIVCLGCAKKQIPKNNPWVQFEVHKYGSIADFVQDSTVSIRYDSPFKDFDLKVDITAGGNLIQGFKLNDSSRVLAEPDFTLDNLDCGKDIHQRVFNLNRQIKYPKGGCLNDGYSFAISILDNSTNGDIVAENSFFVVRFEDCLDSELQNLAIELKTCVGKHNEMAKWY